MQRSNSIRLLRTPRPYPDESLKGYIIRVTEVNGYENPSAVLNLTGKRTYLNDRGFTMNWPVLSNILNVNLPTLKKMAHCSNSLDDPYLKTREFFGYCLHKYHIRTCQPKICPLCLRGSAYVRKVWDLAALTTCPIHKCFLIDTCPNCREEISWDRSEVGVCKCKFDWRGIEEEKTENRNIIISRQIYFLCKLDYGDSPKSDDLQKLHNPLFSLALPEFLSTLFFISGQLQGITDPNGKFQAPNSGIGELNRSFVDALAVLNSWPTGYFNFLEKVRGKMPISSCKTGVFKDFGKLYLSLYGINSTVLPSFLRKGFEQYLAMEWKGGRATKIKSLPKKILKDKKYLLLGEAKQYLQLSCNWIEHYFNNNTLRGVIHKVNKKRLFLIETESAKKLKVLLKCGSIITFQQVTRQLGVGRSVIMGLIHSGHLTPVRGHSVDGFQRWNFNKENLDDLLNALNEKTQRFPATYGGKLISFNTAIKKLLHLAMNAENFIQLIFDGKITPRGNAAQKSLSGFKFDNAEILEYRGEQMKRMGKDSFTLEKARKIIGVKYEVLSFLIRKKIINTERDNNGKNRIYTVISQKEISRFKSTYLFTRSIARKTGTSSGYLTNLLMANHIMPITGPTIDQGRQYIFRKRDIEGINLTELVKRGREDSKRRK